MSARPVREELMKVLRELERRAEVPGCGVVRRDGLMIVSDLPSGVDARRVAAMTAAIVGTAERSTLELEQGEFRQTIVEGKNGKMIAIGAGPDAILFALARPDANLGLILLEMERAVEKIRAILGR